jgi:hypothetical protein
MEFNDSVNFGFIGWNTVGNSDKVWGYFSIGNIPMRYENCYIFWGRRGKTMNFKSDRVGEKVWRLEDSKREKGYKSITFEKLLEIWPTFQDDLQTRLSFCTLASKIL